MIKKVIEGKPTFIPSPGSYLSNFCYIDDVVRGHAQAMEKGLNGEKYILGGENVSYTDFFNTLKSISASKAPIIPAPKYMAKMVAWIQWIKHKLTNGELSFTTKGLTHIYCNKAFSSQKAIQHLGYTITSLKTSLETTIQFLNHQKNEP